MSIKKGKTNEEQLPLRLVEPPCGSQTRESGSRQVLARVEAIDAVKKRRDRSILIKQLDKSGIFR